MTNFFNSIKDYFSGQQFPTQGWLNFFSWRYWTEANVPAQSAYSLFFVLATVAVIVGLTLWRRRLQQAHQQVPVYADVCNHLLNLAIFIGIIAASYLFFRSQQLVFVSSRLVILVTLLVVIGWLASIIFQLRKRIPDQAARYLEKQRFFRYLPKRK